MKGKNRMQLYKDIQLTKKQQERFWKKVNKKDDDSCWEWNGARTKNGYGSYTCQKIPFTRYLAHRIAYTLAKGKLNNLCCHTCDNKLCCNPSHLFDGTHHDNLQDAGNKGRLGKVKGEKHPRSKLKTTDIKTIRKLHLQGLSLRKIASQFNVDNKTIRNILKKKNWRHV
jgi:hypothetical protein